MFLAMTTVSAYRTKAPGYVGTSHVHPALLDAARESVHEAKESGLVSDGFVARCGDDIGIVFLHSERPGSDAIPSLASDAFSRVLAAGKRLHQLNTNGSEPSFDGAEISVAVRESEPVLVFFSGSAVAGAWNAHLYRAFGDPFNTPSLIDDDVVGRGFSFASSDGGCFELPEDAYRLLKATGRGTEKVVRVTSRATGEVAAAVSSRSDPVLLVRCSRPFPSVEEVLEAFSVPYAFGAALGGAGPLVPVSVNADASTRGVGRAIGLGFQVSEDRLIGPRDLLGDPTFDDVRREAAAASGYMRRHGPFTGPFTPASAAAGV